MRYVSYFVAVVLVLSVVVYSSQVVVSQSVLVSYSVDPGLRAVSVFRYSDSLYLVAWNVSSAPYGLLLYNLNTSSRSVLMSCDNAGYIVSGGFGFVVCGKDLYRVYPTSVSKVYSFYAMPYFIFYDYYADRVIAFINTGFGTDVFVVDVFSGAARSYGFIGWFIYGFAADYVYYYTVQFNGVNWWLVKYTKDFSRVVRNVSIPMPLAANTSLTRYSAFAVNDLAVIVLFDGYTVLYDKNLNVIANATGFIRVEATVYHFYAYDSGYNVYVLSPTGYVYPVNVYGLSYFSMVGKYLYMNDLGVVYNDDGYLYIVKSPNDIAFVTVTSTVAMPYYVTRTVTSTTAVSAYGFDVTSYVLFFGLLLIVIAIFVMLRRK